MLPTLFVSHGSPLHATADSAAARGWHLLAQQLPRPQAVLIASAHWETELPMVATSAQPATIHDFGGFPDELYRIRYAAPGATSIAMQALELLNQAGFSASANGCRGLDHGAWVPLRHMYPEADIPVAQIAIQPALGAAHHLQLGRHLASLAAQGVLIMGSGHVTHNLREFMSQRGRQAGQALATVPYVDAFSRWLEQTLTEGNEERLSRWSELAPGADRAHPSPEHFLPLPFAYGAAGVQPQVTRIDLGVEAGVLAMDAYLFKQQ